MSRKVFPRAPGDSCKHSQSVTKVHAARMRMTQIGWVHATTASQGTSQHSVVLRTV